MGVCERVMMSLSLPNDSGLCGERLPLSTLNTVMEVLMEDIRVRRFETMDDEESSLLNVEM